MIRAKSLIVTVSLLVVSALIAALMVVVFGNITIRSTHTYHADFADVSGMKLDSDVRSAGVPIGRVTGMKLESDDHVLVTFTVDKTITLLRSVHATIKYKDLLNNRFLELTESPGTAAVMPPGTTLPMSQTSGALDLDAVYNSFQPLFTALSPGDVNTLTASIIDVFQGQSGTIDGLLGKVGSLTNTLADSDKVIGALISNLNTVLGTVNGRSQETSNLIVQVQTLVSGLNQERSQITGSFSHVSALSNSVAGLLQDIRPNLKATVDQIGTISAGVNADTSTLDHYLDEMPLAYRLINRQGQYGSTFNFYLCGVQILTDADTHPPLVRSNANRCQDNPTGLNK